MPNVIGTWRLVRVEAFDANDKPVTQPPFGGPAAIGRVVLTTDGRMMASIVDGRKTVPTGETREYSAYCGNYTFDGKQLITRVDAASDPARMGTDQVRDVHFEGNLMVLRPPLRPYGARPAEKRILYWEKISDV